MIEFITPYIEPVIPYLVIGAVLILMVVIGYQYLYRKNKREYLDTIQSYNLPESIKTLLSQGHLYVSKWKVIRWTPSYLGQVSMERMIGLTLFRLGLSDKLRFNDTDISVDYEQSSDKSVILSISPDIASIVNTHTIEHSLGKLTAYWCADHYKVMSKDDMTITMQLVYGDDNFLYTTTNWTYDMAEYDGLPYKVMMGLDEYGNTLTHSIYDTHTLIAGVSGSGKGSIIWNILAPLAGREDTLIYGIDLKGGMEFGQNENIFVGSAEVDNETGKVSRKFATDEEDAAAIIDYIHDHMEKRSEILSSSLVRQVKPSKETPLIVLVIDEAIDLDDMARKKEYKDSMENFKKILRKGRAAGITVIAALQNPNVSAFQYSRSFPSKIALRMANSQQMGFIGPESLEIANLDAYHKDVKGICLIATDTGEYKLVKAFYPDDAIIQSLPHSITCSCNTCISTSDRVL